MKYRSSQHEFYALHKDFLEFDYCSENFDRICQLCLDVNERSHSDEADESATNPLNQIQCTLSLELIDLTAHKICENCHSTIESINNFKTKCEENLELLRKLSNEFESQKQSGCEEDNSLDGDDFKEDEQVLLTTPKAIITSTSGLIIDPIKINTKIQKTKLKNQKRTSRGTVCQVCGKIVKGIQTHMLIHQGIKKFECKICNKSFVQSGQLKRHVNSHLNIRNYKCPHPGCDKTFVDPSSVTKHLVVHNKDQKNFICTLCGASFTRLGALRYHEKTHRDERNHQCDQCEKKFLAKYDLTKHYRVHTKEKPYSCPHCPKRFSISKNAKVHLRVHTKEKPFTCATCSNSFSYLSSLKQHTIKCNREIN